jgi:hypothetical protein
MKKPVPQPQPQPRTKVDPEQLVKKHQAALDYLRGK